MLARPSDASDAARSLCYYGAKRTFDLTVSAVALALLSPVLLLLALLIRVDSPGPVLYSQRRVGLAGKEFLMYKFRTMRVGTPELATHLLADPSQWVTAVGRLLRRTSLDELPQLFNVLVGQMSIVGPRPALYNQADLIAMRHELSVDLVLPGITGWAQVNGRDELSLEDKVALDREYLIRRSFRFDMFIAFLTLLRTATGHGIRT